MSMHFAPEIFSPLTWYASFRFAQEKAPQVASVLFVLAHEEERFYIKFF